MNSGARRLPQLKAPAVEPSRGVKRKIKLFTYQARPVARSYECEVDRLLMVNLAFKYNVPWDACIAHDSGENIPTRRTGSAQYPWQGSERRWSRSKYHLFGDREVATVGVGLMDTKRNDVGDDAKDRYL